MWHVGREEEDMCGCESHACFYVSADVTSLDLKCLTLNGKALDLSKRRKPLAKEHTVTSQNIGIFRNRTSRKRALRPVLSSKISSFSY